MYKANKEEAPPVFFHTIQPVEITTINVLGDVEISYIGFGDESKLGLNMINLYVLRSTTCSSCWVQPDVHVS